MEVSERKKLILRIGTAIEAELQHKAAQGYSGTVLFSVPMSQGGIRDARVELRQKARSLVK